jgi:hypothetical protein
MFPIGYSNRSPNNRRKTTTDASSARSREPNLGRQQTQPATYSGHASTNTYQDSELAQPSLDHMFSTPTQPSNSNPRQEERIQSLYENIERQLLAEPSSSSSRHPETPAEIANFQRMYDEFAQLAAAPSSKSGQQSTASTQSSSQAPISHYPGVRRKPHSSRWVAEYRNSITGSKVWVGSFTTEQEAISALEVSRASYGLPPADRTSKWQRKKRAS